MNPDPSEPIVGRPPTAEEQELIDWSDTARRTSIHSLQDGLRQMVALVSALLAGSAGLYTQLPVSAATKGLVVVFLMAALAAALVGWLPWLASYDVNDLDQIRHARERLQARKGLCLSLCGAFMWLAFLFLVCSLIGA